jgi:hypothetical protein
MPDLSKAPKVSHWKLLRGKYYRLCINYWVSKMNDLSKEPVYNRNVIEILTVANEYCLFIEKTEEYRKDEIINYLHNICPLLYLKGVMLPSIQVDDPDANERFVTEEQWEKIFNELRTKLLPDDEFWYINEWTFVDSEISKGSIAENLADIYQDLKDFVILYQKNTLTAKQNAVNSCKVLFEVNWGPKILQVQKALHYLLYKNKSIDNI